MCRALNLSLQIKPTLGDSPNCGVWLSDADPEQRGRRRFFGKGINFSGALRLSKNVALEDCNSEMK